MPEIDGGNGWERWRCLVEAAHMLSEGIPLEQLMINTATTNYQEEKPTKSDTNNSIQDSIHGFLKKGKRSSAGPRKEKSTSTKSSAYDHDDTTTTTSTTTNLLKKKSNLRIIFKTSTTVIRTQEGIISKKIAIKKHHDAPETSTARENAKYLGKRRMDCENDDVPEANRAKKKKRGVINAKPPTSPRRNLPQEFKDRIRAIGGCPDNAVLVIQKKLTKTDVSSGHSRLSVPYSQVEHKYFLNLSEVKSLEKPKADILATLVQPCLEECNINLRNWKTNNHYALVKTWNEVCIRNKLKEGMKIQLWSFRRNLKLCFALVPIVV
ncbi:hypothetical protein BUALT_Bualt09G0062900 [Buddleja alternifolia]|uniref:B3 domain-containing protein n=1 Tax=Buddleja alternifolia TaxID=168488 RepID=A0AAV6XB83_9LAMI|nr:hypothetical protein BUALT_Bualt09G0062900 [Buddleja alternifolia]